MESGYFKALVVILVSPLISMCAPQVAPPMASKGGSDAGVVAHTSGGGTDESVQRSLLAVAAHYQSDATAVAELCKHIDKGFGREIFGVDIGYRDNLQVRVERAPVDQSCVFEFSPGTGEPVDPRILSRLGGVRVDVFSDRKLRDTEYWGTLESNWNYRCRHEDYWFRIGDLAWACWADSEHAPDRSLLINGGEFMFEVGFYPPTSFKGAAETDKMIEAFAAKMLRSL